MNQNPVWIPPQHQSEDQRATGCPQCDAQYAAVALYVVCPSPVTYYVRTSAAPISSWFFVLGVLWRTWSHHEYAAITR